MVAQTKFVVSSAHNPEALSVDSDVTRHQLIADRYGASSNDLGVNSQFHWLVFLKLIRRVSRKSFHLRVKRLMDIVISLILLIILAPLFALVAILIKLTDRGPILFWQTRVGFDGQEFEFPKFRSMIPDAEHYLQALLHLNDHKTGVTFKLKKDPRITWIGSILRQTSMDELPQLLCVLVGDMSLVGPRPAVPREVALYSHSERRRLYALPGLTGIWQVSGRGDLPFHEQVAMDIKYIEKQSFWLDLKLLILTIPAVLSGKGAY